MNGMNARGQTVKSLECSPNVVQTVKSDVLMEIITITFLSV